jgi:acyl-[acyl-carrier-protein]-phospholipid O-acyltransferase/long-chain-fatty-acid--[acyl-carrier-protein] ligase
MPFLLFSATSGTLADRFSKRNIIVSTKILELVTMASGVVAFSFQSKIGSYSILFLMATQSALFGPSKYGIVPELVTHDKITKANGLLTSFTFLAIIIGTFLASFILDISGRNFILAALFCTAIALAGLLTSFCIEYTPPSGSKRKLNAWFLVEIYNSLKVAKQEPSLITAVFGSAFFLFVAAFAQLNLIPYAVQALHFTDVQGGYLFLLTALGIGTGSVLASKLSGKIVELALAPLAAISIAITLLQLDFFSNYLFIIIPSVLTLGVFGGIYMIPLDSFIQVSSPNNYRGQIVAATNFVSFFGVLCASGLLYMLTEIFGLNASKGFVVVGIITFFVFIFLSFQYFDYLTRFIAMIFSRLHFRLISIGEKNIPESPAIYVCTHKAWNDTLILLGSQRRRIRFFIESEQEHTKWMKKAYRMLRVVFIPPIEPFEKDQASLLALKKALHKGISVCILISSTDVEEEISKLRLSCRELLEETPYPIIPVYIDKGEKNSQSRFFTGLLNKLHVPATISFGEPIKKMTSLASQKELFYLESN